MGRAVRHMTEQEKKFTPVNCSFCQKEMRVDQGRYKRIPLEEAMVYSGCINWNTIGYGSDRDGERWLLAICDDCLHKAKPLKKYDYMSPDFNYHDEEDQKTWEDVINRAYEAVVAWQNCSLVHPLTCATEGCREVLSVQRGKFGKPYLLCEKCGYIQKSIPGICLKFDPKDLTGYMVDGADDE